MSPVAGCGAAVVPGVVVVGGMSEMLADDSCTPVPAVASHAGAAPVGWAAAAAPCATGSIVGRDVAAGGVVNASGAVGRSAFHAGGTWGSIGSCTAGVVPAANESWRSIVRGAAPGPAVVAPSAAKFESCRTFAVSIEIDPRAGASWGAAARDAAEPVSRAAAAAAVWAAMSRAVRAAAAMKAGAAFGHSKAASF